MYLATRKNCLGYKSKEKMKVLNFITFGQFLEYTNTKLGIKSAFQYLLVSISEINTHSFLKVFVGDVIWQQVDILISKNQAL